MKIEFQAQRLRFHFAVSDPYPKRIYLLCCFRATDSTLLVLGGILEFFCGLKSISKMHSLESLFVMFARVWKISFWNLHEN